MSLRTQLEVMFHLPKGLAESVDAVSIVLLITTLLGILPNITAVLVFVWICLRIANELMIRKKLKKEEDRA